MPSYTLPKKYKEVSFKVNGVPVQANVACQMTLAEFIREKLDLTGTKVGCNRGECGSCTVLMDNVPVYSCTVLAVEATGREIKTIEGIADGNGRLHPLQQAFIDEDAFQCGYCTPGMLISLMALLDENPAPAETDIRNAVDGHLCRCGCYPNIIKATLKASEKMARKGKKNDEE
jgi:aerobic-type carbon monoxide dehydrogenase small subunit (CoxS/CutS family)